MSVRLDVNVKLNVNVKLHVNVNPKFNVKLKVKNAVCLMSVLHSFPLFTSIKVPCTNISQSNYRLIIILLIIIWVIMLDLRLGIVR